MIKLRIRDSQIQELSYLVLSFILQPLSLFGEDGSSRGTRGWGGVDHHLLVHSDGRRPLFRVIILGWVWSLWTVESC
jgi:hypothetical protein